MLARRILLNKVWVIRLGYSLKKWWPSTLILKRISSRLLQFLSYAVILKKVCWKSWLNIVSSFTKLVDMKSLWRSLTVFTVSFSKTINNITMITKVSSISYGERLVVNSFSISSMKLRKPLELLRKNLKMKSSKLKTVTTKFITELT